MLAIWFKFWVLTWSLTKISGDTNLPVVYYVLNQIEALTEEIGWVQLSQCVEATANNTYLQITIIQPSNPIFDENEPFTVVEISSCKDSFESSCIIGTNYVKNGGHFSEINGNITIPFDSSIKTLSIRYQSYYGATLITLHITYVNSIKTYNGIFDADTFATSNIPQKTPGSFGQYIQNHQINTVKNDQFQYYFVSFCETNIIGDYTVGIMVSSDPSTPLGAFDLIGCSKYYVTNSNDCTFMNKNAKGVVVAQTGASITQITMDSSQISLSEGFYVGVYGFGGEESLQNNYLLSIVTTSQYYPLLQHDKIKY